MGTACAACMALLRATRRRQFAAQFSTAHPSCLCTTRALKSLEYGHTAKRGESRSCHRATLTVIHSLFQHTQYSLTAPYITCGIIAAPSDEAAVRKNGAVNPLLARRRYMALLHRKTTQQAEMNAV